MPTYEYECEACGHAFEQFQSITAPPIKKCPNCDKKKVKRLLGTGAGLIFKGKGFYITDYRSDAYNKAATADMILFSMSSAGDLPHEVKLWIERWLNRRSEREGALIGLVTDRPANPFEIASLKEVYLRHTAHRAKMDYLSHEIPTARKAIPDSIDSYNRRAGQMTSVLDQILRNQPTPSIPIL